MSSLNILKFKEKYLSFVYAYCLYLSQILPVS